MRNYIKLHGYEFSNSNGLPVVQEREEDTFIGNAPGWSLFSTPRYEDSVSVSNNTVLNAVTGADSESRNGNIALGQFQNGQRSVRATDAAPVNYYQTVAINPDAWSFLAVIAPSEGGGVPQYLVRHSTTDEVGDKTGLIIGWTGNTTETLLVYKSFINASGNPVRLSHVMNLAQRSTPTLICVTFSTERGLSIFDNGVLVATAPDDKTPLDIDIDGPRNLMFLQNTRGDYGPMGLLNTDFSAAENAGHRRAIEKFLMQKYH
ncbi:MAG: hypothetical protein ACTH5D_05155 [Halomonas sp.]|uniref:hypothetical protein n=1 Tax=Halomonas sp. TaxID=1486246 RepID=UPI003F93B781